MANRPISDVASEALRRALVTKFPTVNPVLPTIAKTGEIIPAGHIAVPQEEGMGSGPGGTTTTPPPSGDGGKGDSPSNPIDWRSYLEDWGFDSDTVKELDRIFRSYDSAHVNDAASAALHYIRGTEWYARTFPGINAGMQKGIISNERDYRAYTNQLNEIYQRYYGRSVTGQEVSGVLGQGYAPGRVEAGLQGQAYVAANRNDLQYLSGAFGDTGQLTDKELQAYGEEKSGLDSFLGQEIQRRLNMAQQRFQGVFRGVLATPALSLTKAGRLQAPGLGQGSSDVSA